MFQTREVSSGYFETMRLPIVRGRGINASDREAAAHVAVINEAAVRRFFSRLRSDRRDAHVPRHNDDCRGRARRPQLRARSRGPIRSYYHVSIDQLGSPGEGDLIVRTSWEPPQRSVPTSAPR